jgi:hypothetical protein
MRFLPPSAHVATSARRLRNSSAVCSPLARLHFPQLIARFSRDASPPRLIGWAWSMFMRRFFVKSTGVWQYVQTFARSRSACSTASIVGRFSRVRPSLAARRRLDVRQFRAAVRKRREFGASTYFQNTPLARHVFYPPSVGFDTVIKKHPPVWVYVLILLQFYNYQ